MNNISPDDLIEKLTKQLEDANKTVDEMNKKYGFLEINKCSKCGLRLDAVMGYVCGNSQCPCGLGGVQC